MVLLEFPLVAPGSRTVVRALVQGRPANARSEKIVRSDSDNNPHWNTSWLGFERRDTNLLSSNRDVHCIRLAILQALIENLIVRPFIAIAPLSQISPHVASDRGRWRFGRRFCRQHRVGVWWQGRLGGQVRLLRWQLHVGHQRHQRC